MSSEHWTGLPFLDALRPEPDETVEIAILATYSLDLVALVASMLSLAGLDDDRGSGSKVDFANAFEKMRGKLRVLVQAGRIAWPKVIPGLMGILDRFVQEIPQDETHGSWHPKIALVKFRSDTSGAIQWRLWIGSRNLSKTMSWETGLLLIGSVNGSGQKISNLSKLGRELVVRAGLDGWDPDLIAQELEHITWQVPAGAQVEDLQMWLPESVRKYPACPGGIKSLILVSPFCDGKTLAYFGAWGNEQTERYLLSTIPELAKLKAQASKPLAPFATHLLTLEAPDDHDFIQISSLPDQTDTPLLEENVLQDLHAKLVFAEHDRGCTLWLGSANVTHRGWLGPNVEVMARLQIDETIQKGIWAFLDKTKPVTLAELPEPAENDEIEERLETARKQVVNQWAVHQIRQPDGVKLVSENTPHPHDLEIQMDVGLITGNCLSWPRERTWLDLPLSSKAKETSLVLVRLSLGGAQASWVQIAPLDPPPDEERDHRALAAHLSPRVFLLWLRSMLAAGEMLAGGEDWQASGNEYKPNSANMLTWWGPTLEEVLTTWTRRPENIKIVDQTVQTYLRLIREENQAGITFEEQELLKVFEETWQVIRAAFVEGEA